MDFDGPTRVRPRMFTVGTSHARWALLARPAIWVVFVLPLAGVAGILTVKQEDHVQYFAVSTVLATLVSAAWLLEALSVVPIVCKWRHGLRRMPAAHNPQLSVSCSVRPTSVMFPALIRVCVVRVVQAIGLIMALVGAQAFSLAKDAQLTVEGILGLSVVVYLVSFLKLVYPYAARGVRSFCCRPKTGRGLLRVVQYNISGCVGQSGYSLAKVVEDIKRLRPDVVALQEVCRSCKMSADGTPFTAEQEAVDQLKELAKETGLHATFCSKTVGLGGDFGNALLSRWPPLETSRLRLMGWKHHSSNRLAGPMPQIALAARFRPEGFRRDVWVVSTQFGLDASGQEQIEEMREVIHWARAELHSQGDAEGGGTRMSPDIPPNVVLCGDLASPSSAPCMRFAHECGLRDTCNLVAPRLCAPLGTFPARRWRALFATDKVLVTADSSLRVILHSIQETTASNHRPVSVMLADAP